MEISRKDYAQHYSLLSDEALLEVNPEDLVPEARECLAVELAHRGLNMDAEEPAASAEAEDAEPEVPEDESDPFVIVAEYTDVSEAELARSLLRGAEVPAMLLNDQMAARMGVELASGVVTLLAPESMLEFAHQLLAHEISDEELAAQAEAAGTFEDEESEEE